MIDNILQLVQQHKAYQSMFALKAKIAGELIGMSIPILLRLKNRPTWDTELATMRNLPAGSLGKDIANALDKHGHTLIPKFENHDAQHILLDYEMNGFGEIQLQFFLLGNGHKTLVSKGSCLLGLLVFPECYKTFKKDYYRGKAANNISSIDFEGKLDQSTADLKHQIFSKNTKPKPWNVNKLSTSSLLLLSFYFIFCFGKKSGDSTSFYSRFLSAVRSFLPTKKTSKKKRYK